MTLSRLILETGMGNDLYGEDYTKAACRAVQDAIHHSSINIFRSLNLDSSKMLVKVRIGVAQPDLVDSDSVKKMLPHGIVSVDVVPGGLNISDSENKTISVIATAAVEALLEIDKSKFRKIN
tara:strand:- start:11 stop:376 length:366 start_codon:yes stop_codon:yes gene_type:complete